MITALPGPQPINFNPQPYLGCPCDTWGDVRSLVLSSDDLVFQFRRTPCPEDLALFSSLHDLLPSGPGWTYTLDGSLRVWPGAGTVTGTASFGVLTGHAYRIEVSGVNLHGEGFTVSIGGHTFEINSTEDRVFTITATDASPLTLTTTDESGFLLASLRVYSFGDGLQIKITDSQGEHAPLPYASHVSWFTFAEDTVTVMMPVIETGIGVGECFTVTVEDTCEGGGSITSQSLRVVDPDCSLVTFRGCLDAPAMGFQPFAPRLTVPAMVGRASWNVEGEEERSSDGVRRITSGDRGMALTVRTGAIGYDDHNFLSSLALWDHVYAYQSDLVLEVAPTLDRYEPNYDACDTIGPVEFTLRLRSELIRKVACGALGEGCHPDNDPICPRAAVSMAWGSGGDRLNLTLDSVLEFMPGDVTVTINDRDPVVFNFDTDNLPSTVIVRDAFPYDHITIHIANADREECFDEIILSPPFVCEGPGTASIVVAPGGGTKLFVTDGTSTHFTIRGPSHTFTWPLNALDGIEIGDGPWCIYASDAAGNPGGIIYDLQIGMFTQNDIMSVDLSRMSGLQNVSFILVETAATFAPLNADLENISIGGAALISALPSFSNIDGLQSFSIDNMSVLSALPDFSPDALVTLSIQSCQSLSSIGILPKINQLDIADTGITDPAVVDALVNALHPASGGIATFNGLLSLRTSASDTNYNACILAGWTIS